MIGTELYINGSKVANVSAIQPPTDTRSMRDRTSLVDAETQEAPSHYEYGDATFTADFGTTINTYKNHLASGTVLNFQMRIGQGSPRPTIEWQGRITSLQPSAPSVEDLMYFTATIKAASGNTYGSA